MNSTIEDANRTIDDAVSSVTDFFGSIIPGLGGNDSVMISPPKPRPSPMASFEKPRSDGFLSTPIEQKVTFDSLGNAVVTNEFLGGQTNVSNSMSFDDYVQRRLEQNTIDGFRDNAAKRTPTTTTGSGSTQTNADTEQGTGILSDYGSISIPIPPSIVPTIFGKPSINLRVNGDVAVHLAYRDNQFLATTGALFSGSETGLDFRQEVNMNLSGSVGDKIKINTDFASLRQFSFENLFKLSYQGYPDEIIQSIEAGNVTLTTPSKYIGIQSALFGFKAVNRFGPLYLTAVAAQKKGDHQSKTFGGGEGSGSGTEYNVQPSRYRRNQYFLDSTFISRYEAYYATVPPNDGFQNLIEEGTVQVWRLTTFQDVGYATVKAWYDLPPVTPGTPYGSLYRDDNLIPRGTPEDVMSSGPMKMLDTNQYTVNHKTGVLTLYQEPSDEQVIAVSYKLQGGGWYGERASGQTDYVLKLIKPRKGFTNPQYRTWKNLLKNSYYVGATMVDEKDFQVKIQYTYPTGEVYEYVRAAQGQQKTISVMGLDRYDNTNGGFNPDGQVDLFNPRQTILDKRNGTLTFPYLEPFGKRILDFHRDQIRVNRNYKPDSTFYIPEIYTQSQDVVNLRNQKNLDVAISVRYSGGTGSSLNLNAFNLVEGSVRVSAGGRQLQEGVDYRVDIHSGQVTLLKPDLASAGPITVDYDQHDFFTTTTKSLLGLRGDIPLAGTGTGLLGFSMLNYSQRQQSIKTRQGEEPFSNWTAGADASYSIPSMGLTNALNSIPIFNLKEKSAITFRADAAISLPNPNTQVSPMPVDEGKSIAYLDDFEGGKTNSILSMNYGRWVPASQPDSVPLYLSQGLSSEEINRRKSKMFWFEKAESDVRIVDIKPNKSTGRVNETAQVLDLVFDPFNHNGIYNQNPADGSVPNQERWGGMMQYYNGLNVAATNTDAIEFWVRLDEMGGNPNGMLHFDMGKISEDIIPDGKLETEDRNLNGRYDPDEDTGLDTIFNNVETINYPLAPNQNDPSNDDYVYDRQNNRDRYDDINGQQGNQNDPGTGLRPDTEDLDNNGTLNQDNSYFQYDVPLNTFNNKYIIGQSDKGWYQFHIPLSDFARTVGNPEPGFTNVQYFRLWFTGYTQRLHLRFYEINLVGSQWTRGTIANNLDTATDLSGFAINFVNIEDNTAPPTNYTPPPGAERDKLTGQSSIVYGNEQSLALSTTCLQIGESRQAVRLFPSPNDLFNYRGMAIWAHGDDNRPEAINTVLDTLGQVWVYVRFGTNRYNYYEYRRPLVRGWQNLHIDFSRLSSLKATKLRSIDTIEAPANDGVPGSMYRVIGSPNITNAPVFMLGLENHTGDNCLATEVWFDELRLLEGNDKIDVAMNAMVQTKLAEFGTITANILNERPDFHRADERFNQDRVLNYSWGLMGEFQMQKIFPSWLERGSVFPLTVSHTESINRLKYQYNTDVEIEDAIERIQDRATQGAITQEQAQRLIDSIRLNNETLTISNSIAATGVRFNWPGSFFLLPTFVNRLTYGFGYAEQSQRSPQYEYNRAWSWTASLLYDLSNVPKVPVSPLKSWLSPDVFSVGRYSNYTINLLPTKFSAGISMTRGRKHYLDRTSQHPLPPFSTAEDTLSVLRGIVPFINRAFGTTRGIQFSWKLSENGLLSPQIDYGLDVTSNLAHLETSELRNGPGDAYDSAYFYQRKFSDIMSNIFFTNGALANLGNDYLASQRVRITTSPRLPWLFWIDKFVRPIFSYTVDYKWNSTQTPYQNAKTGYWTNNINTGIEVNLRELGLDIFGSGQPETPQRGRGARQSSTTTPPGQEAPPSARNPDDPFAGGALQPAGETRPAGRPHVVRVGDANMPTVPGQSAFLDTLSRRLGVTPNTVPVQQQIDTTIRKAPGIGTEGERGDFGMSDTVLTPIAPPEPKKENLAEIDDGSDFVADAARAIIHKPFFDWNGMRFNFIQTNTSLNGALQGSGSGITNFFAGGITHPEWDGNGPSRAYQLGLITDPHGRLLIRFKPQFPFISFGVRPGDRAASPVGGSVNVTDVFTQKNIFELTTSRPLWSGAQINLNWKTDFTYDERNELHIDANGKINPLSTAKIGDVSRTFLSIPPLPFLNISQSGIETVGKKWIEKTEAIGAMTPGARDSLAPQVRNRLQVESFLEGFETLPWLSGALREYLPRLNYSFSWGGMEKLPLFSFADRVSFRHGYNGNYKRQFRLDPGDTLQMTTLQTVIYGFRPLIAMDFGWDKVWGGRMTASLNYDTQTEWGADYASNRITKRFSSTFGINANFTKQGGFEIPFLNIKLKNTFGMTFLFSQTISSDIFYQFNTILTNPEGTGNGGITKTTIEPRFSYDMSQQLTIEGFYRYERTIPAATGVLIPPTRLILAGFDIRLKIF